MKGDNVPEEKEATLNKLLILKIVNLFTIKVQHKSISIHFWNSYRWVALLMTFWTVYNMWELFKKTFIEIYRVWDFRWW